MKTENRFTTSAQQIHSPADRFAPRPQKSIEKSPPKSGGFTLIEILVAIAVSAIGIIGGLMLYRSSHRALNVVQTTNEIQQRARKVLNTFQQELQETSLDTIDWSVENAISFASAREGTDFLVNDDGTPDWTYAVVYYLHTETSTLYRYVEAKGNWDTLFDTQSFVNTIAIEGTSELQGLVSNVVSLEFELIGDLLEIQVGVLGDMQTVDIDEVINELTTQVHFRN